MSGRGFGRFAREAGDLAGDGDGDGAGGGDSWRGCWRRWSWGWPENRRRGG